MNAETPFHAGMLAAEVFVKHGVRFAFTLCGGHISPLLVGCKARGIRVIDVRDEVTTVFAADAVARLSGVPGVAMVTAGPGLTNTITAVKNAQLAQSPVLVLGGATATILKGRGALQDIDQFALMKPHVKWAVSVRRVRDMIPTLERAFAVARSGVPGPVFIECPIDLLYPEPIVRQLYGVKPTTELRGLNAHAVNLYLRWHLHNLFAGAHHRTEARVLPVTVPEVTSAQVAKVATILRNARRPLLLIGSQIAASAPEIDEVRRAVVGLGIPTYLGGMARGLLGREHPRQFRHRRKQALSKADVILLAGLPADFRLNYGRDLPKSATLIAINRSPIDLKKNRRPNLGVLADPGAFLRALATTIPADPAAWAGWVTQLRTSENEREREIDADAQSAGDAVNVVRLCRKIDETIGPDSVIIGDGGDFVATASYIVKPRGPLRWLDPGAFGTLGVGAGFALGARLCHPQSEVWVLFGDGSFGYSLSELDTFMRHKLPVIAVIGNDAAWAQIAREQVDMLGDDVGTVLRHTDYHAVAQGFGAEGLVIRTDAEIVPTLARARELARAGKPVLVNAIYGKTAFRKGSISM